MRRTAVVSGHTALAPRTSSIARKRKGNSGGDLHRTGSTRWKKSPEMLRSYVFLTWKNEMRTA
jgi:hypothetical protein